MSRYIKFDDAVKVMACEMYAEAQSQGYDVDGIEDFMPEAKAWLNDAPSIDIEPNSSEIPNNSTISKMEQVEDDAYFLELMGAVERGEISDAGANQAWHEYINHKDEPQTEEHCENCRHKDECEGATYEYKNTEWWCLAYAPIDEPQMEVCDDCIWHVCNYNKAFEDEPQTDGYMTAEQTEDYRKMLDKAERKVYGNIEDEPQTDCAWR